VLVVGTTADYIEWVRSARPGRSVFVTSPDIRQTAEEPAPSQAEEVLCDLTDAAAVIRSVTAHLERFGFDPVGVACFDCESMALAALVAHRFNLSYPSAQSIDNCRNKGVSKSLWRRSGIDCPDSGEVSSLEELKDFFISSRGPIVIKPANGSGSELVFHCETLSACEENYATLRSELELRKNNRLYLNGKKEAICVISEAYVEGDEYSCDFLLQGESVHIIRVAKKIRPPGTPFGTIGGYVLPAPLPAQFIGGQLSMALKAASQALGLHTCIAMADFIVCNGRIHFLEMTPRPGGDCLPLLLRRACSLDVLSLTVDVAGGYPVLLPDTGGCRPHMGIRIHARTPGRLKRIEVNGSAVGSRVLDVMILRRPGHRIVMPPADYDSWVLGHIVLQLADGADPDREYRRVQESIVIEVENETDGIE